MNTPPFQPKSLITVLFLINLPSTIYSQAFSDESINAGIVLEHDGDLHCDIMAIGTGAAWFDYDRDGDLDLYITMRLGANKLYRNNGDGTFTDVAVEMGVADILGDGAGVAVADFNNDGYLDIYLANGGPDRLFRNNNGTSFTDITISAGFNVSDFSRGTTASWGDYNNDGFLDLYVSHHNPIFCVQPNASLADKLFRNEGNETFTDVTELISGGGNNAGFGFIGGWVDYDKDGDLDIIVVNDCLAPSNIPTKVFENKGDTHPTLSWNFEEVSVQIGINDCRNGMGLAAADYDRNGWMDLYYSNIGPCVLFENNSAFFTDVSAIAGVDGQENMQFSWGTCFFDYDLDGWQDLYLVLGSHHYPGDVDPHPDMLYHNNANGVDFDDVSVAMAMNDPSRGRTAVVGDYDNDGDPDVLLVNYGEPVALKRNNNNNGNHFLKVRLIGTQSNRDGIGAFLKLTAADNSVQYFETRSGSSLGGGDAIDPLFGLGANTMVSELEITWPSGIVQTLNNVSVDQTIVVEELVPLPVELEKFTANVFGKDKVKLEWHTLSEINNSHFEIERSRNGMYFMRIAEIKAASNATEEHFYHYVDEKPLEDTNYYRLKQVDYDGKFEYSQIRSVSLNFSNFNFKVFPNPVRQKEVFIEYSTTPDEFLIEIFDSRGKRWDQQWMENIRTNKFTMDISTLPTGFYIIKMTSEHNERTQKLIVY